MFSHARRIAELENRVRDMESDLRWIKNELSGYSYQEPVTSGIAYVMGYPAMIKKRSAGLIEFRAALLRKLRLRFVEKPASMELEEDV